MRQPERREVLVAVEVPQAAGDLADELEPGGQVRVAGDDDVLQRAAHHRAVLARLDAGLRREEVVRIHLIAQHLAAEDVHDVHVCELEKNALLLAAAVGNALCGTPGRRTCHLDHRRLVGKAPEEHV